MRHALLGKATSAKQDDDTRELWEKTYKEADGRLLRGPFSVAEVDGIFLHDGPLLDGSVSARVRAIPPSCDY